MWLDPLHLVHRSPGGNDSTPQDSEGDLSEKALREQSIRRNRRQRFVDCITSEDVSMGVLALSRRRTASSHV